MTRSDLLRLVPNGLSLARAGLGLAFPFIPAEWRLGAVALAAASDALDGLTARWLHATSGAGRLLDPLADKVFVVMVAGTLLAEGAIDPGWAAGVAARDLVVLAGSAVLALRRQWSAFRQMRPTWLGKGTTVGQFAVLLAAVLWGSVPVWLLATAAAVSVAAAAGYAAAFFPVSVRGRTT